MARLRSGILPTISESAEHYRAILQSTADGFWRVDIEGSLLDVNERYCEMSGYSRDELLMMNIAQVEANESIEEIKDHIKSLRESGFARFESRHRRKDGSIWDVEVSTSYLPVSNEVVAFLSDITMRKQAEQALSESEARYRRITECLTDYQYTVRVENGRAVETKQSPACAMVTGYTPDEFAADPYLWINMVVSEDRELVRAQVQKILAGEDIFPVEHRIIRKDGETRWIRDSTILFKNERGVLLSYDGVLKDITELKIAQIKLLESEQKYRQLFQSMQNGFALHEIICDEHGVPRDYRFLEVNPAFERLTGLKAEQVIGHNVRDVLPGTEPFWIETFGKVALSGVPINFENYSEQLQRYYEVTAYSPQSRLFATIITDITDRKHAEKELQNKNSELEHFTYTVSHDLKSPLITIQTYAGMILRNMEAGDFSRAQGDMKRLEDAASKMTALLHDLLELSRVGRIMNPASQIDMNILVRDVLAQLAGPLMQKQVEVTLPSDLTRVFGDYQRIAEALQNLVENAVKYMGDQPAPRIEIGSRQDGNETVFFISDNGKGIDPRYHENIFGLFNKLDTKSEGTGLGLALVKRIIEVHGGRVWVESEGVGQGSRFCFTLPKGRFAGSDE